MFRLLEQDSPLRRFCCKIETKMGWGRPQKRVLVELNVWLLRPFPCLKGPVLKAELKVPSSLSGKERTPL